MDDNTLQDDEHQDEFERDESIFHPDQVPRLSEDGARPAAPASDIPGSGHMPLDDPLTDSDIDADEAYNEGIDQASGASTTVQDSDTIEVVDDEDLEASGRAR